MTTRPPRFYFRPSLWRTLRCWLFGHRWKRDWFADPDELWGVEPFDCVRCGQKVAW